MGIKAESRASPQRGKRLSALSSQLLERGYSPKSFSGYLPASMRARMAATVAGRSAAKVTPNQREGVGSTLRVDVPEWMSSLTTVGM